MEARQPFNVSGRAVSPEPHSAWHSPVPYLFGGLAAMLGLIAFALLILACSYWKLSGYLENGEGGAAAERDLEAGDDDALKKPPPVFEEKILVIMAGDVKPTFIATPACSRSSSSVGDAKSCNNGEEKGEKCAEMAETKEGSSEHQNLETQESSNNQSH